VRRRADSITFRRWRCSLRGYGPDRFKTPGTNVNIGTKGDVFVITEEQRLEMQRINRKYLLTFPLCLQGMGSSATARCLCERQRTGVSPSGHGVAALPRGLAASRLGQDQSGRASWSNQGTPRVSRIAE